MMTHDELIAALEKATGSDRRLDEEIILATGWSVRIGKQGYVYVYDKQGNRVNPEMNMGPQFDPDSGKRVWDDKTKPIGWANECEVLNYTGSLDAARTLVPTTEIGEWRWVLSHPGYDNGKIIAQFGATIYSPISSGGSPMWDGYGKQPAIALCIAALQARRVAD